MLVKLKANIPEIAFGILLAVAIFALGTAFESSRSPPTNEKTTEHPNNRRAIETADKAPNITDWLLVLFNGLLFASTVLLWRATERSTRNAEKALLTLERAYIVPVFPVEVNRYPTKPDWEIQISLTNAGRSFAIVKGLYLQFVEPGQLPQIPPETGYIERTTDTVLDAGEKRWGGMGRFKTPTKKEGQILFGYIRYEDMFERLWRNRFAVEVWSTKTPERHYYQTVGGRPYNTESLERDYRK